MSKFMFGADPETFVLDTRKDIVLPAYFFYPDTGKGNCAELNAGGVHADNVMMEFNPLPSASFVDVAMNVHHCMEQAHNHVYDILRNKALQEFKGIDPDRAAIRATSFHSIPDAAMPQLYGDNVKFFEFGCDPDYNAHTRDTNKSPELPQNVRVAGGHIMISAIDERLKDPEIVMNAVRWMDALVMPTIMNAMVDTGISLEASVRRRAYYGKAGSFRPKTFPNGAFGIEYRTPGPEWLLLGMGTRGRAYLRRIEIAMLRSVENALEFKQCPFDYKLIDAAVNRGSLESMFSLMEASNHV